MGLLVAQWGKNLPAAQEIQARSLGREEGNGKPLQCPCLENPMDRGAWWASVHGVAKSQARLSDITSVHFTSNFLEYRQDFRDVEGLILDHHNKLNIAISNSHESFGFLVHIKVTFTLYHSLVSVQ